MFSTRFLLFVGLTSGLTTKSNIKDDNHISRILTFDIESSLTCFYEPLKSGMLVNLAMRPTYDQQFPMQFRLTSPNGEFSEWVHGDGDGDAALSHNATTDGSYEICLYSPKPIRINFFIQFYNPEELQNSMDHYILKNKLSTNIQNSIATSTHNIYKIYYTLKFQNQMVVRDEALQIKNGDYVQVYSVVFCCFSILISLFQVFYVRKLFYIDPKKIRI